MGRTPDAASPPHDHHAARFRIGPEASDMESMMEDYLWLKRAALVSALCLGAAAVQAAEPTLADSVRTANDRFQDVAVAMSEGYMPMPCVSGPAGGAMGVHYVNGDLIKDDAVDVAHPEAVMYEPGPDGRMTLVGVEYITFKGPAALEGHLFNFNGAPNRYGLDPFYELHVWAWKANPTGTFSDMNPDVSCDAMMADGM
jgi:hypothetical protein